MSALSSMHASASLRQCVVLLLSITFSVLVVNARPSEQNIVVPASTQLLNREDAQRLAKAFPLSYLFYPMPTSNSFQQPQQQQPLRPPYGQVPVINQFVPSTTKNQGEPKEMEVAVREQDEAPFLEPKKIDERSFEPIFDEIPEGFQVFEAVPSS